MTMAQLLRLTESGEDSTLEFARDGIANAKPLLKNTKFMTVSPRTPPIPSD